MVQSIVASAFKPEALSSIPSTFMVGGKNLTPASCPLTSPQMLLHHVCIHTETHTSEEICQCGVIHRPLAMTCLRLRFCRKITKAP